MATPAGNGADTTRATSYPFISEAAWWQLRKMFTSKMPKVLDTEYLITAGIRENQASAANLVRPFKRFGLFKADGTPDLAWDWIGDEKYPQVCREILHTIYPESLTDTITTASDEDRARLERWFQRNSHLTASSARQYAAFYMLLLEGDPTKQDTGTTPQVPKLPAASAQQTRAPKQRPPAGRAQAPLQLVHEPATPAAVTEHEGGAHAKAPQTQHGRGGFEPTLNINVQIHIPSDATPAQIEQIFKSMATHLYQRQDEAHE
jgi:hypothetical protein